MKHRRIVLFITVAGTVVYSAAFWWLAADRLAAAITTSVFLAIIALILVLVLVLTPALPAPRPPSGLSRNEMRSWHWSAQALSWLRENGQHTPACEVFKGGLCTCGLDMFKGPPR